MSGFSPETRVEASPTAAVVSSLPRAGAAALVGAAAAGPIRSLLAQNGVGAPALPVLAGLTAAVAVGFVLALAGVRAAGTSVRFGRESLAVEGFGALGSLAGGATVDYDDIELVLRRDTAGDRRVGTASYELVRLGESNVQLNHCADPETVQRELEQRVPTPRSRVEAVEEDAVRTGLQRERVFWRGWPSDEPVPRSAVVSDEAVLAKLDGAESVGPSRDDDDEPPRRSSPGPDRPRALEGLTRDGSISDAEEFTGGTGEAGLSDRRRRSHPKNR